VKEGKTVFISHPIRGNVPGNIQKVLDICRLVHRSGNIPVVPYIASLMYLDDAVEEDRALGINANLIAIERGHADELWLYGDTVSTGMKAEVRHALWHGMPVIAMSSGTIDGLRSFLAELEAERNTEASL
jgi:hypothetical protein